MINASTPFNITMNYNGVNWTCTWDNISLYTAGDYKITIWATDNSSNVNQTEFITITITDLINPSVTILYPEGGNSYSNTADLEINATITDLGGSITAVAMKIPKFYRF